MPNAGIFAGTARRCLITIAVAFGLLLPTGSVALAQGETANVLMFSGTTGYRHGGGNEAIQPDVVDAIQDQLADAGMTSDYHTCNGTGTGGGALPGCRNETEGTPAIFTEENLADYDAIFFWQASSQFRGQPATGPLFNAAERAAIEGFVNDGGGIAAMHASMTMAAGDVTWDWWDAPGDSAIGALMPGHSATDVNNVATVEVSDRNHPSTRDLPDSWEFGDEHYTFSSNVRGTHHVLMTLDEESYDLGSGVTSMGADHPIAWCRLYDGGKIWGTSLGHFAESFRENDFDNELMTHLVGGVAWAAGVQGQLGDCGGTVWSNFSRTVLTDDVNGPIGLDVSTEGDVYFTEIGAQGIDSEGRLRMYDASSGETETLLEIPTRADYQSSNAGVLGMALDPDFEENRHLYVYYSPRVSQAASNCDDPAPNCVADNSWIPWHNVVSRFTLNAAGDDVVEDSEQEILRVRKVAVGDNNQDGLPPSTYSAHQGGALSFDGDGNLYLGTGDDVDPFGDSGNYAPIDQRFEERYDARNTSASTNDLRGKILRITPLDDAEGEAELGETYEVPDGNMFEPGQPQTRPEIYAMGFRNPFTVHADPANPGTVVVGEYAPDAGSDSATRGPAGAIEWDHITEPGFHGWPLCAADNSAANSYNRYEFPSGPSGDRFDCSADEIPNESEFQTGLDEIPGPAVPADIWSKPSGTPERFNIPNARDEANTGPIYDYDPSNPSETKWPAYYDGSWLIFNRNQNYWREARITDDGSDLLRVNGFFQPNQFGTPQHDYVIPTRFGPDGSLYLATWSGGCCRSGLPGIGNGEIMRIDYVGDADDEAPPIVTPDLSCSENDDGDCVNSATLSLSASDVGGSGVDSIEYAIDGGDWEEYDGPLSFDQAGDYTVAYRATDNAGNTSEPGEIDFTLVVIEGCEPVLSDEFAGGELDPKWELVRSDPGRDDPAVEGGALVLPLGSNSVDQARPGPLTVLGQPLPETDFTVEAEISAPGLNTDSGNVDSDYAQVGFKVFQTDDDWIKVAHTRNADGGGTAQTYFEMAHEDDGNRVLGTRMGQTDAATNLPTFFLRVTRSGDTITGAYSLEGEDWTGLGQSVNVDDVFDSADGPVYVGAYGGNGTIDATYEYIRFDPDELDCPDDIPPPVTTASLDPEEPGAGGTYDGPVEVTLSATADSREPQTHDVDAQPAAWNPDDVAASVGDEVAWHFPSGAGLSHDVWLIEPDEEPDSTGFEVTDGPVAPGGDPVSHTFETAGTWIFVCKVHSFVSGGEWTGMVGTVDVGETTDASSGVAGIEHRTNFDGETGDWELAENTAGADPFEVSFVVSEPGAYEIEYRAINNAGSEEDVKSIEFEIADDVGDPELNAAGLPGLRKVGPKKKQTQFRLRVRNTGDGDAERLRLCARAPKARVNVQGQICRVLADGLAAGDRHLETYRLRIKPPARGKLTKIRMTANGPGMQAQRSVVRLRVK